MIYPERFYYLVNQNESGVYLRDPEKDAAKRVMMIGNGNRPGMVLHTLLFFALSAEKYDCMRVN